MEFSNLKIAVISDIHGNLTALEAVVADILAKKVDEIWVLGDLVMPGPGAKEVLELLFGLRPTVFIRGNWDDLLLKGIAGKIALAKPSHVYFSKLALFSGQQLTQETLDFLANCPIQKTLKRGPLTLSLTHNLPNLNYGQKLYPTGSQIDLDEVLQNISADVAIYAHVHHQLMRYTTNEQIVLNPGSVGEPFCNWQKFQADLRAQYLLLEIDEVGLTNIDFCKVDYDREKEQKRALRSDLPYLDLYLELLKTGKVHTHDQELLRGYNEKYGYTKEIERYRQQCNVDKN